VLERGDRLERVDVRYRLEGTINAARDNVVLVVHALTGTTHASDWWKGVIGANEAIDPTRHAVLCANLLGGCDGTTGPSNETPDALPPFSTRDQAALLARLLDALGVAHRLIICPGVAHRRTSKGAPLPMRPPSMGALGHARRAWLGLWRPVGLLDGVVHRARVQPRPRLDAYRREGGAEALLERA
jgi:hypothetical protein